MAGWGLEWINDHINGNDYHNIARFISANSSTAGNKANKPIVLEEFGVGGLGEWRPITAEYLVDV